MSLALRTNSESARKCGPDTVVAHRPALTTTRKDRAMANEPHIDISTLRQLLSYDPETGKLTWLPRPREMFRNDQSWAAFNTRRAGTEALTAVCKGHLRGKIFNRDMYAHRVAYALHHGAWPEVIDHINGDPADNRISNLRDVGQTENMRNQRLRSTNSSGVTGVDWDRRRQKWRAQITVDGRNSFLGNFADIDSAVHARRTAEARFGFHANHGQRR